MKDATTNLLAALVALALMAGPASAEEGAAKEDGDFLEDLSDDAGDFFEDVGSFFADDVPEFFTEDVPDAFSGDSESQAAADPANPFAGQPKVMKDKRSITEAQALLNAKGYEAGPEDGLMGRKTRMAIGNYQKDNQLKVTGAVTDQLLLHLKGVRPTAPSVAKVPQKKELDDDAYYSQRDR